MGRNVLVDMVRPIVLLQLLEHKLAAVEAHPMKMILRIVHVFPVAASWSRNRGWSDWLDRMAFTPHLGRIGSWWLHGCCSNSWSHNTFCSKTKGGRL